MLHVSTPFASTSSEIYESTDCGENGCSRPMIPAESMRRSKWSLRKYATPFTSRTLSYTPYPYWYSIFERGIAASATGSTSPFFEKYLKSIRWAEGDSNSQPLRDQLLRLARIPIPPSAQINHPILEFDSCPPSWIRTNDRSLKRRLLYQLSYGRKFFDRA